MVASSDMDLGVTENEELIFVCIQRIKLCNIKVPVGMSTCVV